MKPTKSPDQTSFNNFIFWGSIVMLVSLFYWWRSNVFSVFPFNYDEGIHLILGKLWAAGYSPYREIFVSYPPFFLWSLGIPWKIFSQAGALRLLMVTYALAGVLAVIYLGLVYNSRLAGLSAGVILSFTPTFFVPSFAIMTEVPSISIAVAAIALAEKYRRCGKNIAGVEVGFGPC
jgi:4-amino-4-deoxy-L-arabinose transferase-like glycosyltransferase